MLNSRYTVGWIVILALGLLLEAAALVDGARGDTLSEHIWTWASHSTTAAILFGSFWLWLSVHFARGVWKRLQRRRSEKAALKSMRSFISGVGPTLGEDQGGFVHIPSYDRLTADRAGFGALTDAEIQPDDRP